MRLVTLIVLAAAVAGAHAGGKHTAQAAADEVTSLPGWTGTLPSKWFSGMLPIAPDMFSHYIHVEREVWVWRGASYVRCMGVARCIVVWVWCGASCVRCACAGACVVSVRYPCRVVVCCWLMPRARE